VLVEEGAKLNSLAIIRTGVRRGVAPQEEARSR